MTNSSASESIQAFVANQMLWRSTYVIDAQGNYADANGSSRGISNNSDLDVLKSLRRQSDVIVTTGETARKENYRPSKVAPIAFITRNASSLTEIAAFAEPGNFPNYLINETTMLDLHGFFVANGFQRPLFEVGPQTLPAVLDQAENLEMFLAVTGSAEPEASAGRFLSKIDGLSAEIEVAGELLLADLRVFRMILTPAP